MTSGVSNLGTFLFQTERLTTLRSALNDAQRQIATGKKTDILAGLDIRVQEVQRIRADIGILESYVSGIERTSIKTDIIDTTVEQVIDVALELRDALSLNLSESTEPDVAFLQGLAESNLSFIQQLLNIESNGDYLLAGSNTSVVPYEGSANLIANTQTEITAWFDGTQTVDQFITNIQGLADQQLGFNLALNSSTPVTARIDDNRDVDYTVLANEPGFQDVVRVIGVLSELTFPDETNPAVFATGSEYHQVLRELQNTLNEAIDSIRTSQSGLAIARTDLNDARTQHINDIGAFQTIVATIEDVDIAEAVARLQTIEVQLNASFQTISSASELTLVNFL